MRAGLVDLAFAAVDGPGSPHDFAIVLRFEPGGLPGLAELEAGAKRAREAFPRSCEALIGKQWVTAPEPAPAIREVESLSVDDRVHLERGGLPQQAVVRSEGLLLTRFHHAQCDLISAFAWLGTQLGESPEVAPLVLKRHAKPVRVSRYAFGEASEPVQGLKASDGAGRRAWLCKSFAARTRPKGLSPTTNDVLAAAALSALQRWNAERGGGERVALWMPVNVRESPYAGFGNGSSRVRIHAPSPWPSLRELPKAVRERLDWSREHGEWATPRWAERLTALPDAWVRGLLRRQAADPRVDMGTTMFSHVGKPGVALRGVTRVEVISHLMPRHAVAMTCITLGDQTHLTLTWDESRLERSSAAALADDLVAQREAIESG